MTSIRLARGRGRAGRTLPDLAGHFLHHYSDDMCRLQYGSALVWAGFIRARVRGRVGVRVRGNPNPITLPL